MQHTQGNKKRFINFVGRLNPLPANVGNMVSSEKCQHRADRI